MFVHFVPLCRSIQMDGAFSDPNAKATMLIGLIVLPVQHEKGTGLARSELCRREKARGTCNMTLEFVSEQSPGRCISDAALVKSMEVDAYFRATCVVFFVIIQLSVLTKHTCIGHTCMHAQNVSVYASKSRNQTGGFHQQ